MNPIICYFYEYKNHHQIRTVGFAKIKQRYRTILVEMYLKGVLLSPGTPLTVHTFYKENADTITFPLLTLKENGSNFHCRFTFQETQLPEGRTLSQMDGLLLTGPSDELFIATWINVGIDTEKIRPYTAPSLSMASHEQEHTETATDLEAAALCETVPDAAIPAPTASYQKISRRDISGLPRNCWALANNSFLIHGFHNYHHLLLMEKDGHLWLGVPGIRDEKEERAASMFGFPTFQQEAISSLSLLQSERNDTESFGYWCHKIN